MFSGALRVARGGVIDHVRLAWGSVAPVPVRSVAAEAVLLGARPGRDAGAAAVAALTAGISPIDDIRSDRDYRLEVAGHLLAQFLRTAHAGFRRG